MIYILITTCVLFALDGLLFLAWRAGYVIFTGKDLQNLREAEVICAFLFVVSLASVVLS